MNRPELGEAVVYEGGPLHKRETEYRGSDRVLACFGQRGGFLYVLKSSAQGWRFLFSGEQKLSRFLSEARR